MSKLNSNGILLKRVTTEFDPSLCEELTDSGVWNCSHAWQKKHCIAACEMKDAGFHDGYGSPISKQRLFVCIFLLDELKYKRIMRKVTA